MSDPANASPRAIVILIHGTWGQGFLKGLRSRFPTIFGPRWFDESHEFRESLTARLQNAAILCDMHSFQWSGGNSFGKRRLAALDLARRIRELRSKYPRATMVVIAHSHGGNVAFQALRRIGNVPPFCHVVTMATPFLHLSRVSEISPHVKAFNATIKAYAVWVTFAFFTLIDPSFPNLAPATDYLLRAVLWVICLSLGLPSFEWGIVKSLGARVPEWVRKDPEHFAEATSCTENLAAVSNILVIRGVDDEASMVLAASAISTRLSHLLLTATAVLGWPLFIGAITILSVIAIGGKQVVWGLNEIGFLKEGVWLSYFFMVIFTVMATALLVSYFCRSISYGIELGAAPQIDVTVDSVPDGSGSLQVVTLMPTKETHRKLRHRLYENPSCVETIAIWLSQKLV